MTTDTLHAIQQAAQVAKVELLNVTQIDESNHTVTVNTADKDRLILYTAYQIGHQYSLHEGVDKVEELLNMTVTTNATKGLAVMQ